MTNNDGRNAPEIIITSDISSKRWLNVIRRCQSVAKSGGYAAVSITVIVDADGVPVVWLEPIVRKFEPKGNRQELEDALLTILGQSPL